MPNLNDLATKIDAIQYNINGFRIEMGRWSNPYSLTKDEALYLFAKHVGVGWWGFHWKEVIYNNCYLTPVLNWGHEPPHEPPPFPYQEEAKEVGLSFLDKIFQIKKPDWYCLGHTSFWTRDVSIHERDFVIPDYNSDLHILLHEIAHAQGKLVSEAHSIAWEDRFKLLCFRYSLAPVRQHMTIDGQERFFY